jgi:peptide methionine sulfoxide reductase MsrB
MTNVKTAHAGAVPCRATAWHRAALLKPTQRREACGLFKCVCRGASLFSSRTKFDSGTGCHRFWAPVDNGAVREHEERSWLMCRTEVRCASCARISAMSFAMAQTVGSAHSCTNGVTMLCAERNVGKVIAARPSSAADKTRRPSGSRLKSCFRCARATWRSSRIAPFQ